MCLRTSINRYYMDDPGPFEFLPELFKTTILTYSGYFAASFK